MASAERARHGFAAAATWLAAWTVAMACGGGPAVDHGAACGFDASGSIVAADPGRHRDPAPLAIPLLAETEICDEDLDPSEVSSHSGFLACVAPQAAGRAEAAGLPRRVPDPSVLVANAADLSRLCRLLL